MKKVIFGTGFLICGTLSALTFDLIFAIHSTILDLADLRMFITPFPFDNLGYLLLAVGVCLNIWGLVEKDNRPVKKVVLGTGLLTCGVLGLVTTEIIDAIHIVSPFAFGGRSPYWYIGWVLFLVGIALNIWGLVKRGKTDTPAV